MAELTEDCRRRPREGWPLRIWAILRPRDSQTRRGAMNSDPVARALLGKSVGDEVKVRVPKGNRSFEVLEIRFD